MATTSAWSAGACHEKFKSSQELKNKALAWVEDQMVYNLDIMLEHENLLTPKTKTKISFSPFFAKYNPAGFEFTTETLLTDGRLVKGSAIFYSFEISGNVETGCIAQVHMGGIEILDSSRTAVAFQRVPVFGNFDF
jgi:hypothetical protein